jgi:hypothetical protein
VARRNIKNKEKARAKELLGVSFAMFTRRVVMECDRCGVLWSIENPKSSRLWRFPPIRDLRGLRGYQEIHFDSCMYDTPWRKATTIWTNASELQRLAIRCCHSSHPLRLRGSIKVWDDIKSKFVSKTATSHAGAYPIQLCEQWAKILKSIAPQSASHASPSSLEPWRATLRSLVPRHGDVPWVPGRESQVECFNEFGHTGNRAPPDDLREEPRKEGGGAEKGGVRCRS